MKSKAPGNDHRGNLEPLNGELPSINAIRTAWRGWAEAEVAAWSSVTFVSLNFKPIMSTVVGGVLHLEEQTARREVKKFGSRVDRAVYRNHVQRFNKRVSRIAVLEYGNDRGWHCHLAMEKPLGMTDLLFNKVLNEAWSKSAWSSGAPDIREAEASLVGYLTKYRSKSEMESWSDAIILEATVTRTKYEA
jgi:hypothetical protein